MQVAATYSAVAIAAVIIFFIGQVSLFAPLR